jgi:hypothetical protein
VYCFIKKEKSNVSIRLLADIARQRERIVCTCDGRDSISTTVDELKSEKTQSIVPRTTSTLSMPLHAHWNGEVSLGSKYAYHHDCPVRQRNCDKRL